MKKLLLFVILAVVASFNVQAQRVFKPQQAIKTQRVFEPQRSVEVQKGLEPIPGQYIVQLNERAVPPVIKNQRPSKNREAKERGNREAREKALAKVREKLSRAKVNPRAVVYQYADVIAGFTARLSPEQRRALERDPEVAGVYQDYRVQLNPNLILKDPSYIKINFQTTACAVSKAGGPAKGEGKPTWIWILDTGIDLDHPDLNVQTSSTYAKSFISGQSVDDLHGHGTHVAGIAGAKNNTYGVVGVSAGARVVPVKVLSNSGSGSWSSLISGLNHVAKYDISGDVVNMSLGGYGYSDCQNSNPTLRNAIRNLGYAGTWVVMAAGNNGADANRNLPGCINGSRVYTVGALTCNFSCASYSNWGTTVDWAAVGSNVYSTYKGKSYKTMSGTSMASPVVAGIIHARGGAPLSAGSRTCSGRTYKIARR